MAPLESKIEAEKVLSAAILNIAGFMQIALKVASKRRPIPSGQEETVEFSQIQLAPVICGEDGLALWKLSIPVTVEGGLIIGVARLEAASVTICAEQEESKNVKIKKRIIEDMF